MEQAKRVIKNTGFLYAKMGITMFISLYTTRLILNALGASDFGIYAVVGGAISMLGFLHAAMSSATQRFMSFYEGKGIVSKQKQIFNVSLVLHFGIALLLGIVLLVAGYFFFNGILNIPPDRIYAAKVVYASLIISTMFTVMSVPYEAVLNAHENMLYYSVVGVFESVLKLSVAFIVVYYMGDKLELYGMLMACIPLLVLTVMRVYCHKQYKECVIAPKRYWEKSLMKEMTSFAGWSFMVSVSSMLSHHGQNLAINHFFGTRVNAAQGVGNQIGGQLRNIAVVIMKAVDPVIAKYEGSGDRSKMLMTMTIAAKFSTFILMLIAIPVIVEMDSILNLWLTTVPEFTSVFCQLILINYIVSQPTVSLNSALLAEGNIKKFQITFSMLPILLIIAYCTSFYLGGKPYYLYLIMLVYTLIKTSIMLYFAKESLGLNILTFLKNTYFKIVVIMILGFAFSIAIKWVTYEGILRILINIIGSSVMLMGLIYLFGLNRIEKQSINLLVRKRNFFK